MLYLLIVLQSDIIHAIGELINSLGGLGPVSLVIILLAVLMTLPLALLGVLGWQSTNRLARAIDGQTEVIKDGSDKAQASDKELSVQLARIDGNYRSIEGQIAVVLTKLDEHGRMLNRIDARENRNGRGHYGN
jgi:hypothetical protein